MLKPEHPYIIVSVVSPETDDPATSGRVTNYPCAPTVSHPSLEQGDGLSWSLRGPWRDRGYVTMQALYEQERNSEGAAAWAKYIADGQAGKRVGVFPREMLPREVLRRQACGETDSARALEDAKRTAPVTSRTVKP